MKVTLNLLIPVFIFCLTQANVCTRDLSAYLLSADTTAPQAVCKNTAILLSLPPSGCILIWAKDLDQGSTDDVSSVDKLNFFFDGDPTKLNKEICCSDLIAAGFCDEYLLNLEMWVEDEQGNRSSCGTTVIIQDILDACTCQSIGPSMKGYIENHCNIRTEAALKLTGPNQYFRLSYGPYIRFYDLPSGNYQLCFEKDDDPLNGISTADIVKIQRHILGIEPFNSHEKVLAADVNASNTISAADITEIRKLILGIKAKLSNVPSWIFLPLDSLTHPFQLQKISQIKNSCWNLHIDSSSLDNLQFVSIKMGDLNCSAHFNDLNNRSDLPVKTMDYNTHRIDDGSFVSEFYLNSNNKPLAFQFTVQFNPLIWEFINLKNNSIDISDEHFSLHELDKGRIHIAWNADAANSNTKTNESLFSIHWKNKLSMAEELNLKMDPNGIPAMLIDNQQKEWNLKLKEKNNSGNNIEISQDLQNKNIYLRSSFSTDQQINYRIMDLNGKILITSDILFSAGNDSVCICDLTTTLQPGLYILNLESKAFQKAVPILLQF